MDTEYANTCNDFERAPTVLATAISKTEGERIVVDAGFKSISGEHGMLVVKSGDGLRLRKLNARTPYHRYCGILGLARGW